jgi:nucleoside-diphosphate-sugar epimerase
VRDVDSVRAAVAGTDVVLATANVIAPRSGDGYAGERAGYQNLAAAAREAGVQRLVFPSVPRPRGRTIMGLNWPSADAQTPWTEVDPALAGCIPSDLQRVEDLLVAEATLPAAPTR